MCRTDERGNTAVGIYDWSARVFGLQELVRHQASCRCDLCGDQAFERTAWYNAQPDGPVYLDGWALVYKGEVPEDADITFEAGTIGISDEYFLHPIDGVFLNGSYSPVNEGTGSQPDVIYKQIPRIRSVKLPEGLKYIDSYFLPGTRITEIDFPSTLEYIGRSSFGNSEITRLTLPKSVKTLPLRVFAEMRKLRRVEAPGVTEIGDAAFQNCMSLETVNFGGSVQSVGKNVFYNTPSLKTVDFTGSLRSADEMAFTRSGCEYVFIPSGLERISNMMFYQCENLKSMVVPDPVESIGNFAFYECGDMERIVLPSTLQTIGEATFVHCASLKEIYCKAKTPPTTEGDVGIFAYCDKKNMVLYVPVGSGEAYRNAMHWKSIGNIVEVDYGEVGDCDIDADGQVDTQDINLLINMQLGVNYTPEQRLLGDVNTDGSVDVADLNRIINAMMTGQ